MPTLHYEFPKRANSRRCSYTKRDAIHMIEQFTDDYEERGMIMHVNIPVRDRKHGLEVRRQFDRAMKICCHPNMAKRFRYIENEVNK